MPTSPQARLHRGTLKSVTERSTALRVPLIVRVEICGIFEAQGWTTNISLGGLGIQIPLGEHPDAALLPQQGEVQLLLALQPQSQPISLRARIVWRGSPITDRRITDRRAQNDERIVPMGLTFVALDPITQRHIARHIAEFSRLVAVHDPGNLLPLSPNLRGDLIRRNFSEPKELHALYPAQHIAAVVWARTPSCPAPDVLARALVDTHRHPQPPVLIFETSSTSAIPASGDPTALWPTAARHLQAPAYGSILSTLLELASDAHRHHCDSQSLQGQFDSMRKQHEHEHRSVRRKHTPNTRVGIVGSSAPMRAILDQLERIGAAPSPVLITGETGTGKEVIARTLHRLSPRSQEPFIALNCAAMPENLLDSELFGHAEGAFTGAAKNRPGLFEAAHGGVLFLDEVGDMSQAMQAKLLRTLEDGQVRRIGESRQRFVDVRVLAATHHRLQPDSQPSFSPGRKTNSFRPDLYFRLSALELHLPPLRDRPDDIAELALYFLKNLARRHEHPKPAVLKEDGLALLRAYTWPGNVRELEHMLERIVALNGAQTAITAQIVRDALPHASQTKPRPRSALQAKPTTPEPHLPLKEALLAYERGRILTALDRAQGVIATAAHALGLQRSTLSKRLKRLGIEVAEHKIHRDNED